MKKWYKSKTIWFNALVAASVAAETSFEILKPFLPVDLYAITTFALVVGNAFLRFVTTTGVSK